MKRENDGSSELNPAPVNGHQDKGTIQSIQAEPGTHQILIILTFVGVKR